MTPWASVKSHEQGVTSDGDWRLVWVRSTGAQGPRLQGHRNGGDACQGKHRQKQAVDRGSANSAQSPALRTWGLDAGFRTDSKKGAWSRGPQDMGGDLLRPVRLRGWLRAAPAGIPRSLLPVPPLAGLCSPSSLLPAHTCKPHPRREFVGLLTSPPTLFHALNTDGFRSAVANKLSHACRSQAGVGVGGTS